MEVYTAIARRYRPRTFDQIVGQEHVTTTLINAITQNRVAHAYIFSGPRGIGKTTMARVFAKALNCKDGPTITPCNRCESCRLIQDGIDQDVIEIDAASNRMVEDARLLRESVIYRPLRSRSKIYIIDEVHMLTKDAFNTLLKTLEEPPEHVKFFFATTDPIKLPETITSRCQRFDFNRIRFKDIVNRLKQIAAQEGLPIKDAILEKIAFICKGSVRDAESLLDQLIAYKQDKIEIEDVYRIIGLADEEKLISLLQATNNKSFQDIFQIIGSIFEKGIDPVVFVDQVIEILRSTLITKTISDTSDILDISDAVKSRLDQIKAQYSVESLLYFIQLLIEARRRLKEGLDPRTVLEVNFIKMAITENFVKIHELLEKIEKTDEEASSLSAVSAQAGPRSTTGAPKKDAMLMPLQGTDYQMSGAQGATMMHGIKKPAISGISAILGGSSAGSLLSETALTGKLSLATSDISQEKQDKQEAPATSQSASGGQNDSGLLWLKFLQLIKDKTNVLLKTLLEAATKVDVTEDKILVILPSFFSEPSYAQSFSKLQSKEYAQMIDDSIKEVFGRPLKLEYSFEKSKQGKHVDIYQDPSIKKIVEKFQGIKIIDTKE